MYEHIKDLFSLSRQNKFCAFLIILTLHICTINEKFRAKLDWLLYTKYQLYGLVEMLVYAFCTFAVVLICANILCKGMFHLCFSIECDYTLPQMYEIRQKYQCLLRFGNTAEVLVLPSLLVEYFLLTIMSVHNSWEYSMNYALDQISILHQIAVLLSFLPFAILDVYEKKIKK